MEDSKIIQYGADFAMVGTMSDGQADESSNVLVTVADEACREIVMNKHYGTCGVELKDGTQYYRYKGNGLSITAADFNLFISGVTQKSIVGLCTDPIFRDILLFHLNRVGTVSMCAVTRWNLSLTFMFRDCAAEQIQCMNG